MPSSSRYTIQDLPAPFFEYGRVGVASVANVGNEVYAEYLRWLERGYGADMGYLRHHEEIRRNPELLLEGARSIITFAFSYHSDLSEKRAADLPGISEYALGDDYHEVIREHLRHLCALLPEWSCTRICVDTAPIMERYWGWRSGLGYIGRNGALIVPDMGSRVFLAEIVTDLDIKPLQPLDMHCEECDACLRGCPTGALKQGAVIDCRRCLSYLTIEHRGDWVEAEAVEAVNTPAGRNTLYGCDRCITSCPLNRIASRYPLLPGLEPREEILHLDAGKVREMDQEEFSRTFKRSAIKRAKLAGLKRNAR